MVWTMNDSEEITHLKEEIAHYTFVIRTAEDALCEAESALLSAIEERDEAIINQENGQ
jgi:hypothetical protein